MRIKNFLIIVVAGLCCVPPVFASGQRQALECKMPKATEISVVPRSEALVIDKTQSRKRLQAAPMGTVNPYGFGSQTSVNGYMAGMISMQPSARFGGMTWPNLGASCVWYDTIKVEIVIKPKIVIASDVARDKCMYKATLAHEMKHVKVDRQVVNKYAQSMGQVLFEGLKSRGFSAGPIPEGDSKATVKRMQDTIVQLLELEYKKLEIERTELQRGVDNLDEYKRVQAECPDFKASSF